MNDIIIWVVFVFVGAFLSFQITLGVMQHHYRSEIIERGYGLYCPANGAFAFKGECEQ